MRSRRRRSPGDSGGPTFIDTNLVAGITSYGFSPDGPPPSGPDISLPADNETNSSFGEFSVDTDVTSVFDWIDSTITYGPAGPGFHQVLLSPDQQVTNIHFGVQASGGASAENLELIGRGASSDTPPTPHVDVVEKDTHELVRGVHQAIDSTTYLQLVGAHVHPGSPSVQDNVRPFYSVVDRMIVLKQDAMSSAIPDRSDGDTLSNIKNSLLIVGAEEPTTRGKKRRSFRRR